jgi:hypothetical protein
MQGRRLPDETEVFAEGDYGRIAGVWYGRPPGQHLGSFANHDVTEHPDGTITVSPSILVTGGNGEAWHGYLERGVWRTC